MEDAIRAFACVQFFIIGVSRLTRPEAWIAWFAALREKGVVGVFAAFDPPLTEPTRGRGKMWDTNLTRRLTRTQLTLTLHRCEVDDNISDSDITTMVEGSDRARIAGIVQRKLPDPPMIRALMRRLFP